MFTEQAWAGGATSSTVQHSIVVNKCPIDMMFQLSLIIIVPVKIIETPPFSYSIIFNSIELNAVLSLVSKCC